MSPFGRNAMLHGNASAFVTTTTLIFWPSAVSYTIGVVGSFLPVPFGHSPRGATGMPRSPGISSTFRCANPAYDAATTSVSASGAVHRVFITIGLLFPLAPGPYPRRALTLMLALGLHRARMAAGALERHSIQSRHYEQASARSRRFRGACRPHRRGAARGAVRVPDGHDDLSSRRDLERLHSLHHAGRRRRRRCGHERPRREDMDRRVGRG